MTAVPTVAVIGEAPRVAGFALAGARVYPATSAGQAQAAWRDLPADVAVVVLTPRVADWLRDTLAGAGAGAGPPRTVLPVVMPP